MKPKLIALNLFLLAATIAVIWQMRAGWRDADAVRVANVNVPVKPVAAPPVISTAKPEAPPATKYVDVADKNLFSKDRNATVIVEVPKVEPPKPMPPLPVVYGVMGLPSGAKAIMAEHAGGSTRPVRAGDSIGEFKVLKLDTQNVVFEWNGKEIPKKIEDLVDRSATQTTAAGQPSGAGPAAPPPPSPQASQQQTNTNPTPKDFGIELTATERACKQNDGIAPGAVVDGYKKVVSRNPFGETCRWMKQ